MRHQESKMVRAKKIRLITVLMRSCSPWRVIVCWEGKAQKTWILVLGHGDETGSAGSLMAGAGLSRWPCPTPSICKKGHTEIQKDDSLVLCRDYHESQHWAWDLSPSLSSLFPDLLPSIFLQTMLLLWGPWDPSHESMSTIFQLLSDHHCKDIVRHCPLWAWILKNKQTNHYTKGVMDDIFMFPPRFMCWKLNPQI